MAIGVGERIPSVKLFKLGSDGPEAVSTDQLFGGKTVVLFALPGAFTPTCSKAHLPGYVVHADELRAAGVDRIVCLSVNDAFVMDAWGKEQNAEDRVLMIADGNGDFTRAVGLEVDMSARGYGKRSARYSMLVDDGVVKSLNVEAPRKFEVSSAEKMLETLADLG